MLYLERTVTINKGVSSIDETVILYKGDKNVEIRFYLKNSPFKSKSNSADPTFGQLVIKRSKATPIFSDVSHVSNGQVLFVITAEMIDELIELGKYTFQIRLFNEDKSSRATLPEIVDGILIKEPICDGEEPAAVNRSQSNDSYTTRSTIAEETFDDNGNYNSTVWRSGDLISDVKLNKVEDAISNINVKANNAVDKSYIDNEIININYNLTEETTRAAEAELNLQNQLDDETNRAISEEEKLQANIDKKANKDELPTHVSQLENDAKYLIGSDLEKYISEDELNERNYVNEGYVNDKIGDIGDFNNVGERIGELNFDPSTTVTKYINNSYADFKDTINRIERPGVNDFYNSRIELSYLNNENCVKVMKEELTIVIPKSYEIENNERMMEHHVYIFIEDDYVNGELHFEGDDVLWQGGIIPELEPKTLHEFIFIYVPNIEKWYGGCVKYKNPGDK